MSENVDFRNLLAEVLAGSQEASARFIARYGPDLLHAVRRRLPRRLRPQFDSLDFVHDVWASFFAMERTHDFAQSEELIAFLTRVAQNKVVDVIRQRMKAKKRNINREQPLPDGSTAAAAIPALADLETPSQAVMNEEEWEKLLKTQPPVYRQVLLLLRQGRPVKEVAKEIGISEKTVCRVITRISTRVRLVNGEW